MVGRARTATSTSVPRTLTPVRTTPSPTLHVESDNAASASSTREPAKASSTPIGFPVSKKSSDEDEPTATLERASAQDTSLRSCIATSVSAMDTKRNTHTNAHPAHMRIPTRPSSSIGHHLPNGDARTR